MNNLQAIEILEKVAIGPILKILLKNEFRPILQVDYLSAYTAVLKSSENEKDAKKIYDYFLKVFGGYVETIYKNVINYEGEALLAQFIQETNNWKILSNWISKIFCYLDRFYVKDKSEQKRILWQCMNLYKIKFLFPLKDKLYEAVNLMIEKDRYNIIIDRNVIRYFVDILEYVDIENPILVKKGEEYYWTVDSSLKTRPKEEENRKRTLKDWFINYFGQYTKQYIKEKFTKAISTLSSIEYVREATKYLSEEDIRKFEYIKVELHQKLDNLNNRVIIDEPMQILSSKDTGFRFMFNNEKVSELGECFSLILRSGKKETFKFLSDIMEDYIKDEGDKLYTNQEIKKDPIKFIPELLKFKKKMDRIVEEQFQNHVILQDSKNKAFSYMMNKELYSKYLAFFCDYEMKIGIKGLNEKAVDERLCDIINLFRCLNNKLAFQIEFSKKLSDRLIQGKSQSTNAEKNLITKFKSEAGMTFVNKMTSMLTDLETSKHEMDLYKSQKHRGSPQGFPFVVQILQHGAWEIEKNKFEKIEIPKFLSSCIDDFTLFYIDRHKTQKLMWAYGLGNIEIEYLYLSKKYQSVSTLLQLNILYTLEKYKSLKIEKISEILGGVDKLTIISEVNALVYHPSFNPKKIKTCGLVLTNVDEKVEIDFQTEIEINNSFQANNLKINTIPTIYKKAPGSEKEQELQDNINIKTHRNALIDSTLARIMKGRIGQKSTHNYLLGEVAKQIELFQAQPPQIKERIETLIEKNIIKRTDDDISCYEYVA